MSRGSYEQDDMVIAAELQRRLNPHIEKSDDIDIAAWSLPCDATGGDYYDVCVLPQGKHMLVIGDVSGHGLPAAMIMINARSSLRTLVEKGCGMTETFERVNNRIDADAPSDRFMTLFAGVVDTTKRTLRYCSAGHDSPLWYRPSKGTYQRLDATGIPLGLMKDQEYKTSEPIDLQGGDILLLGTDGIWEAFNKDDEAYGLDRLTKCIEQCSIASARILAQIIQKDVLAHIGESPQRDDITLMVAIVK